MATQPNFIEVTDYLAEEGIRLLTNELEIASGFNTDFQDNLDKEFPVGATFRVPLPNLGTVRRNTLAYTPTSVTDRHTTVTCDRIAGWDAEWDSIELALSFPRSESRIKKKILKPAMEQIKQEFDTQAAQFGYLNTPNIVGTLGTNPTTFDSVYGAGRQRLIELAGFYGDIRTVLSPGLGRSLRANVVANTFNPQDELAEMFRKGYIGEVSGIGPTYESMSLFSHTSGIWATVATGVTVKTGSSTGDSTLVVSCTTGDTFNAGDTVNVGSVNDVNPMTLRSTGTLKQFELAATTVGVGGQATLTFVTNSSQGALIGPGSPYQNVDALPVAGATLTLFPGTSMVNATAKTGTVSLMFGKDAYALVGIKLENPKASSAEIVSQSQDPESGLAVAFIRMFDPISRKWVNRFDSAFGFGLLHNDHCAVRVLGA